MATLDESTLATYLGYAAKHIRPLIGQRKVGSLNAGLFDSFYAELRRCRDHCDRPSYTEHRTDRVHSCDNRCRPHECRPLAASTIRQIHHILSGALRRAVRWRWIGTNPIDQAEPPAQPKPNPRPPTAEQAARILNDAWKDPDWAMLIWLTMVTGLRRGELCGIRWRHLDLENAVLMLERSIGQRSRRTWEKDTKTHQNRRIALDAETVALLAEHRERCRARAAAVGVALRDDAFVFSLAVDGSTHLRPDSVSQRYSKLAQRLGIDTTLHKLRHFSATELITAGVDVRTIAGRLGHGGGGTTTLRVYAAWLSESDQRAANSLFSRMPARPEGESAAVVTPRVVPRSPYEQIGAELRDAIEAGELVPGNPIPTVAELAKRHSVSVATAQRGVALLKSWGLVDVARGQRARVARRRATDRSHAECAEGALAGAQAQAGEGEAAIRAPQVWSITLRGPDGRRYPARHVREDIDQPDSFRLHLLAIARIEDPLSTDGGDTWIGDYELEVRDPDEPGKEPKRVLRWQKD